METRYRQAPKLSGSLSRDLSLSAGTTSKQVTIDFSATEPSMSGKRRRVRAEKRGITGSLSEKTGSVEEQ